MLDFRRVVKNRKIQPEAAFCPTKNQGLEWMNSNPRMQIAQKIQNAPASISVISKQQIEDKAYRDVTDALKDVPGVVVTGGGSSSDISIRGMAPQ